MSIITNEIKEAVDKLDESNILRVYIVTIQDNEEEIDFLKECIDELIEFRDSVFFNKVGSSVRDLVNITIREHLEEIRVNEAGIKLNFNWIKQYLDNNESE